MFKSILFVSILALTACGGGGGDSPTPPTVTAVSTGVSTPTPMPSNFTPVPTTNGNVAFVAPAQPVATTSSVAPAPAPAPVVEQSMNNAAAPVIQEPAQTPAPVAIVDPSPAPAPAVAMCGPTSGGTFRPCDPRWPYNDRQLPFPATSDQVDGWNANCNTVHCTMVWCPDGRAVPFHLSMACQFPAPAPTTTVAVTRP